MELIGVVSQVSSKSVAEPASKTVFACLQSLKPARLQPHPLICCISLRGNKADESIGAVSPACPRIRGRQR